MNLLIEQKKKDMDNARLGMVQGIKYSSRSLGGHTTQYRRLCRLFGIKIELPNKPLILIGKPCRYKKCKGRNHKAHGEKCPIASARGKTGGEGGLGEAKARAGESNGRFTGLRECGCPKRVHNSDCIHARLTTRKGNLVLREKEVREILNINPISWRSEALTTSAVAMMIRGIQGVCSGCKTEMPAIQARKIHRDDIHEARVRVICDACDA